MMDEYILLMSAALYKKTALKVSKLLEGKNNAGNQATTYQKKRKSILAAELQTDLHLPLKIIKKNILNIMLQDDKYRKKKSRKNRTNVPPVTPV